MVLAEIPQIEMESPMNVTVDCPWCDGPAIVESVDHDALSCAGCAIRVELAPEPARETEARAA